MHIDRLCQVLHHLLYLSDDEITFYAPGLGGPHPKKRCIEIYCIVWFPEIVSPSGPKFGWTPQIFDTAPMHSCLDFAQRFFFLSREEAVALLMDNQRPHWFSKQVCIVEYDSELRKWKRGPNADVAYPLTVHNLAASIKAFMDWRRTGYQIDPGVVLKH